MNSGIRASIIIDQVLEQSPISTIIETITRASGYVPHVLSVDCKDSNTRSEIVSESINSPLVVLAFREEIPQWLQKLDQQTFRNSEVIVVMDEASSSLASLQRALNRLVVYSSSEPQAILEPLARSLAEAKEALAMQPLNYVPLSRRTTEAREPYDVFCVRKEVTISPSGHGRIETKHTIRVLDDGFEGTSHYFGLNEYTPGAIELPSLRELLHHSVEERYSGRSFSYRLLSPSEGDLYMSVVEIEHESQPRTKVFRFLFSPEVKKGTLLRFAWSWSHPGVFNPHGEDASTLRCAREYQEVSVGLTFLRESRSASWPFADGGSPILERKNAVGMELGSLMPRQETLLHGTRFEWRLFSEQENTTLSARWRLR